MRKVSLIAMMMLFCGVAAFSQAVKDRNVIPVSVNLNQVLRMTITNGGNIEFVFNTIDQYKNGLSAEAATAGAMGGIYQTDFTVSSSTRWKLTYGAETATFIGTDKASNTLALNNVGFRLKNNGTNEFEAKDKIQSFSGNVSATVCLFSPLSNNATEITALEVYPKTLIDDNQNTLKANAGDGADNNFSLLWRCGTTETVSAGSALLGGVSMNDHALINQSGTVADRYTVNVLFDLTAE